MKLSKLTLKIECKRQKLHLSHKEAIIEDIWLVFPSTMQILKQKNGTETCKNKGGKNSATQLTFCHGKSYHEIEYDKSNKILLVPQPSFKCVLCDQPVITKAK